MLEVLCLLVFLGRLTHFAKVTLHNVFWKDTKNICIIVAVLVSWAQGRWGFFPPSCCFPGIPDLAYTSHGQNNQISQTCHVSPLLYQQTLHCLDTFQHDFWELSFFLPQLSLADLAIYGVLRLYGVRSIRWSRIVRPIFLINFAESRQVKKRSGGMPRVLFFQTACFFPQSRGCSRKVLWQNLGSCERRFVSEVA